MAPKKGTKMDLVDFLADDSLGGSSWADDDVDFSAIGSTAALTTAAIPTGPSSTSNAFGSSAGGDAFPRRERKEYPVPDAPPYRAMISNLPWEANDFGLKEFFEVLMDQRDIVKEVDIPRDRESDRIRGFAFVEFTSREFLEEALKTTNTEYIGRRIYVSVAAPKNDGWSRVGGSRFEDADLDWGAARSSQAHLPPRERGERGDQGDRPMRPRREEPDLDWGSARGTKAALPERERPERQFRDRPKRDEPDLDWGSARGSSYQLPPREPRENKERTFVRRERKEEPDLDWGSARGAQVSLPTRRAAPPTARKEPELDWARGQPLAPKKAAAAKDEVKNEDKPQKSAFAVLSVDDDDEEEEQEQQSEKPVTPVAKVEVKIAALSVDEDQDGWEVVGK